MGQRLCGLLAGNSNGPLVDTSKLDKPSLVIRGLVLDGRVILTQQNGDIVDEWHPFLSNGKFPIDNAKRMSLKYIGPDAPGLQCLFVSD